MDSKPTTLSQNRACNPICTACHYKDFTYVEQLRRKQSWVHKNLGEWNQRLRPIIPAPEIERLAYRSKSWLRSHFENETLSFGMFRAKQMNEKWKPEFIAWNTCPIHSPAIQEMIPRLQVALARHARDFSEKSLFGIWIGSPHLVVVARELELDLLKNIHWDEILSPPFNQVWLHRTNQVGKKVFQHRHFHPIFGLPAIGEPPILAFRQIAKSLLTEARRLACKNLLSAAPALVVDLYCGTGEISQLIPSSVAWIGIEISEPAASFAGKLRRSGDIQHKAFIGSVEERLRDPKVLKLISGSYALFINPPRAGLSQEAKDQLSIIIKDNPPTTLVILSCSASSLGRDLKTFEGLGYRVALLQPYDFFPQTEHFETLAVLSPGDFKS